MNQDEDIDILIFFMPYFQSFRILKFFQIKVEGKSKG